MSTHTTKHGVVFNRVYLLAGSMRFTLTGNFAHIQVSASETATAAEYSSPLQSAELWLDPAGTPHPLNNITNRWSEDV